MKKEMQDWASADSAAVRQISERQETTIAWSRTFPENEHYKELKPIIDADQEQSEEHDSVSKILQYDSDKISVENKKNDNEESLILGRVFEISNENTFLIGHTSRFSRSAKLN